MNGFLILYPEYDSCNLLAFIDTIKKSTNKTIPLPYILSEYDSKIKIPIDVFKILC